jgi:hypothetical protein
MRFQQSVNTPIRLTTCGLLLLVLAACGSSTPASPTPTSQAGPGAAPTPPSAPVMPLTGLFRAFSFERELSYSVRDHTRQSRFVLYDNGALVLQFPGLNSYRGKYTEANGVLELDWGGLWTASGTVQGDRLTVQYSVAMQLDDFENGVYVRTN